jgi:hypothetical protein
VDKNGNVFFIDTGRGVCKIDTQGKLAYIHKVSGGGHFLALDVEGKFPPAAYPQLFKRITPAGARPAILFASGGAPFVVNKDGNLYYGSGYPGGDDTVPAGLTLTRMTPDGKRALWTNGSRGAGACTRCEGTAPAHQRRRASNCPADVAKDQWTVKRFEETVRMKLSHLLAALLFLAACPVYGEQQNEKAAFSPPLAILHDHDSATPLAMRRPNDDHHNAGGEDHRLRDPWVHGRGRLPIIGPSIGSSAHAGQS